MWRIYWAPNSIPIYIQKDATLHSLFTSGNCSACFGWYFYPSSVAHTTVSTASAICHTVTAICRYRGRVGTGLSVLLYREFGKSLCAYKRCWKWCPWASIQAWTRLILFANTFCRSAGEMFLMYAVIAVFSWLNCVGNHDTLQPNAQGLSEHPVYIYIYIYIYIKAF